MPSARTKSSNLFCIVLDLGWGVPATRSSRLQVPRRRTPSSRPVRSTTPLGWFGDANASISTI
eukprot:7062848-Prorocentrum_lima.AAC.1